MMPYFWVGHQRSIIGFLAVLLLIAFSNLRWWRRLGEYAMAGRFPRLSVLVPARNEEANIGPCLQTLLAQDYRDFEVLALDDDSSDGTARVLADVAANSPRLSVLTGQPLPTGWLGKHWACHQLAQVASGELLLFVDADTRHEPGALRAAVAAMQHERADLLAVLPKQTVVSWGERLIVPVLPWSLHSFLPLGLAYRLRIPALSATVGQFMLFRREAYVQIGGHAAVWQDPVDDLALGRRISARGLRWRLLDGSRFVTCRMYHSLREATNGFGKSLFAAFGHNAPLFVFVWLWMAVVFSEPLVVLALYALGCPVGLTNIYLAFGGIALSLVLWGITNRRFCFPMYLTLLYPATVIVTVAVALRSMTLTALGRATWKGRTLVPR